MYSLEFGNNIETNSGNIYLKYFFPSLKPVIIRGCLLFVSTLKYILYMNVSFCFITDNIDDEMQCLPPPQAGTSCPSNSLRDEVERLSNLFNQSGFDQKSVLCLQTSHTPSAVYTFEKHVSSLSSEAHLPESDPEDVNRPEKTVLLDATMEMTLSDAIEIVTVESKVKKPGHFSRPEGKNKQQAYCSKEAENLRAKNSAGSVKSYIESNHTGDQTPEDIEDADVSMLHSPHNRGLSVLTTHVSKHQNKFKAKSHLTKQESQFCDTSSLHRDNYFIDCDDSNVTFSKAIESMSPLADKDGAEKIRNKITCRKSRSKGRRVCSVTTKNVAIRPLPLREHESSQSKLKPEVETEYFSTKRQSMVKSHKSRCRQSFGISQTSSRDTVSPEVTPTELVTGGSTAHPSFNEEYPEPNPCAHSYESLTEEIQSTCKAQGLGSPRNTLNGVGDREILMLEHSSASTPLLHPNPKKASRRDKSRFGKKAALQEEERVNVINKRGERKEESNFSNKESRCEDEVDYVGDCVDAPEVNKEQVRVGDSHCDGCEQDSICEHFCHSDGINSSMKQNTSQLHDASEHRIPRKTFLVYQQEAQPVSMNSMSTSDVFLDSSHEVALLMEEMPPGLAANISLSDTEVGSPLSTPRSETSHKAALSVESAAVSSEASPGVYLFIYCYY